MKIVCIDARMLNNSGIGTYLKHLILNLKTLTFKLYLIVTSDVLKAEEWLEDFNIIILDAPVYSLKEQMLLPFKIPRCDLFFSPHFNVPILKIKAKKRLSTIHDVCHLTFFSKLNFFQKIYARYLINRAIKLSSKIITVSEFSKKEILKYTKAKENQICKIYNGIDLNIFKKTRNKSFILQTKKKYNLPDKYFLFVGNPKVHKNLLNLFLAFEKLMQKYKDINLVIVSNHKNLINYIDIKKISEGKSNLESNIRIIEDVININEMPIIYASSLAFVFPSFYEGFGYPPLEAMATECPVIASNLSSIPEICGDAVFYIDPYDVNSIFLAMKEIIENEHVKKKLIQKANKRVQLYQMEYFVKKHLNLIESLL